MPTNMQIYDALKKVPKKAQKKIEGKRFKGTSINPMWRIQRMTELFGPCGIGWGYEITKSWSEKGSQDQTMCFVNINLFIKDTDTKEWSKGIAGTGGNMIIQKEKSGLKTSDEGYKMALTDALGNAMKALGLGADIYWGEGHDKYEKQGRHSELPDMEKPTKAQVKYITDLLAQKGLGEEVLFKEYDITSLQTMSQTMAGLAIKFLSIYKTAGTVSERIMCPDSNKYVLASDCPNCQRRVGCPAYAEDVKL